jgi:CubicO group peptidase (beta-lactamase class C family)
VVDTEGGLFLRTTDLAKIGYLYLHDGMWDGKQIVSKDWVKQSVTPFIEAEEGFKYGFKWWVLPNAHKTGYIWMARGFGGQRLMVFPEEQMIAVFTGWDILHDPSRDQELVNRILPAVRTQTCGAASNMRR